MDNKEISVLKDIAKSLSGIDKSLKKLVSDNPAKATKTEINNTENEGFKEGYRNG